MTADKPERFHFHVKGGKNIHEVAFQIDNQEYTSSCTCNYQPGQALCWHRYYILSGKTQRLSDEALNDQYRLIRRLSKTSGGSELLRTARHKFGGRESCRRCNGSNVIELNRSLSGRIIKLFLKKTRRFYCRNCKWSW